MKLAFALSLALAPLGASAAGRLVSTDGSPTANGKVLKAGDEIPDAEIRLATGTATIAIDGGRFLLTGPARLTPTKRAFRLDLGGLLSVLTKKAGRRFSVRTPTAVAAVRGTDFFVSAGAQRETDVCICKGALKVSSKGLEPLPLASESHLNYRIWPVKDGTAREKSPMIGHTDAELDALRAALASEKP